MLDYTFWSVWPLSGLNSFPRRLRPDYQKRRGCPFPDTSRDEWCAQNNHLTKTDGIKSNRNMSVDTIKTFCRLIIETLQGTTILIDIWPYITFPNHSVINEWQCYKYEITNCVTHTYCSLGCRQVTQPYHQTCCITCDTPFQKIGAWAVSLVHKLKLKSTKCRIWNRIFCEKKP